MPIKTNSYVEGINGDIKSFIQINFTQDIDKIDICMIKNIQKETYQPKMDKLALDLGITNLFATNLGELYGRNFSKLLKKYYEIVSKLSKNRQKQRVRTLSKIGRVKFMCFQLLWVEGFFGFYFYYSFGDSLLEGVYVAFALSFYPKLISKVEMEFMLFGSGEFTPTKYRGLNFLWDQSHHFREINFGKLLIFELVNSSHIDISAQI